jgi:hydrogenase maturation protease
MTDEKGQNPSGSAPSHTTLILGVGNILLGDEGIGVRVVEAMKDMDTPGDVELLDGGTASLDLLQILDGRKKVIIIDAVQGGEEPGTLYRFTPGDIRANRPVSTSLHQVGLLETLSTLELSGNPPRDITIFGIEPENLDWSLELSPGIAALIPRIIELVLDDIRTG